MVQQVDTSLKLHLSHILKMSKIDPSSVRDSLVLYDRVFSRLRHLAGGGGAVAPCTVFGSLMEATSKVERRRE